MIPLHDYTWSVANRLVKNDGFSLIDFKAEVKVNQDMPSLHLIKNIKREYFLIRLVPANFVWPNHLEQDIKGFQTNTLNIFNKNFGHKIKVLNLYIFQAAPTEEIHSLVVHNANNVNKNFEFFTGYIDLENQRIGVADNAFSNLKITKEPYIYYFDHPLPENTQGVIEEIKRIEQDRKEETQKLFNYGKPILTYLLIGINSLFFILMTIAGGSTDSNVLLHFGAKETYLISQGEYWRLLSSVFLHIGVVHFAFNNLALYYLGKVTEKLYGSFRFLIIYLAAGIMGNIVSILFMPSSIGAGASGAIFGLFGALLYFGYVHPDLFFRTMGKDVISILAINILIGITVPNIDIYAHLGGLVGGFLVSAIVFLPKQKKKSWLLMIMAIILVIAIFIAGWWGIEIRDVKGSPNLFLMGQEALEKGDLEEAGGIFTHLIEVYPNDPNVTYEYAKTLDRQGNYEMAEKYYLKTIELAPDSVSAYYYLAQIYVIEGKTDQAINSLEKSLEIDPGFEKAKTLLNDLKNGNNDNTKK